jgi:serine/threonine protein kinase
MVSKPSALIGRTLHDTYRLARLVGVGGMGAVYEAVHLRLAKKRFAVKVLLPDLLELPEVYTRFRREAEIVTEIGHPHIVEVLDFNRTDDGLPYMVMEYLEGEDLGNRIRRCGRLGANEMIQVMLQIGGAIQAAHDHGVVHRDLKPDNIFLLGQPGEPIKAKVLDFGISKIRHQGQSMVTQEHCIIGTPGFMSPEQAEGLARDVDHTTDIFALGAICYFALSGQVPFEATSVPAVLYKVCHAEPPDLSDLVVDLSPTVDAVLARAMAKAKADRYQRVESFTKDLCFVLSCPPPTLLKQMTRPIAGSDTLFPGSLEDVALDRVPTLIESPPLPPVTEVRAGPIAPSHSQTTLSAAAGEEELRPPVHTGRWSLFLGGLGLVLAVAVGGILLSVRESTTEQPAGGAAPSLSDPDAPVSVLDAALAPDGAVPDLFVRADSTRRRTRVTTHPAGPPASPRRHTKRSRPPMFDELDPPASPKRGKKKLLFDEL